MNVEFQGLRAESTRIAEVSPSNGTKSLNGVLKITFQIGWQNTSGDWGSVASFDAMASGIVLATDVGARTIAAAQNVLAVLDSVVGTVAGLRAISGTVPNRLESRLESRAVAIENTFAKFRIRDVDFAQEIEELTRNHVLQRAEGYRSARLVIGRR